MQLRSIYASWVFSLISICVGIATAEEVNDKYPLQLKINIEEAAILECGVLVGELRFSNVGAVPLQIGGVMSIDGHSGNIRYELESPKGEVTTLVKHSMFDMITVQWSELRPGEYIIHPICLLKLNGEYIFSESGTYRIRAIYLTRFPVSIQAESDSIIPSSPYDGFPSRVLSDWTGIVVGQRGLGWAEYVQSHQWEELFKAFSSWYGWESSNKWLVEIEDNLPRYQDYKHEQEKLLIYQINSRGLFQCLLKTQDHNEQLLSDARRELNRARMSNVGVAMWEWIVKRLESYPLEATGREKNLVRNGYYF